MRSTKHGPIRIQRMNAAELDKAIEGLEKRGFTMIRRWTSDSTYMETSYHQGSFRPLKYAGTALFTQHYAVLKKEEQT